MSDKEGNTVMVAQTQSAYSQMLVMCPPGMEILIPISMILVRQMVETLEVFTGLDSNNRYEILDMGGRRMYLAAEVSNCCLVHCCGPSRPFTIVLLNNMGGIVLKVKRIFSCCFCLCLPFCGRCCNEIHVLTGTDIYIGKVTENFCDCCCPRFTVWNDKNEKVLKIKGPCHCCMCCTVHFKVKDVHGTQVGEIHKQWGGVLKESYTTADTFGVSFPADMDPGLKTLLLGAVFLIDFMYFEKRSKK